MFIFTTLLQSFHTSFLTANIILYDSLFSLDIQRSEGQRKDSPFFRCNVTLAIPNIIMQPALDEVQQAVNKAAQLVLGVAKALAQWNKERKSKVYNILASQPSLQTYKSFYQPLDFQCFLKT